MDRDRRRPIPYQFKDAHWKSLARTTYPYILGNILNEQAKPAIPLQRMYALNCAPLDLLHKCQGTSSHSGETISTVPYSPLLSQDSWSSKHDDQQSNVSSADRSISHSPEILIALIRDCFPPELAKVDFERALSGLDYLQALEERRRHETRGGISRTAIDRHLLQGDIEPFVDRPRILEWLDSVEWSESHIDTLFLQIETGLRRWILLHELSRMPFNKTNCIAMLNTLYPPDLDQHQRSRHTVQLLESQRQTFFRYIASIEISGTAALSRIMKREELLGDDNGWASLWRQLADYLQLAKRIISACQDINDADDVSPDSGNRPQQAWVVCKTGYRTNTCTARSPDQTAAFEQTPPFYATTPLTDGPSSATDIQHTSPKSSTNPPKGLAGTLKTILRKTDSSKNVASPTVSSKNEQTRGPPWVPPSEMTVTQRREYEDAYFSVGISFG